MLFDGSLDVLSKLRQGDSVWRGVLPSVCCRVGEGEPRSKKRKRVAVGVAIATLLVLIVVFVVTIAPRLFSKPSLEGTWTLSSTGTADGITLSYPDVTLVVEDGAFSMDIVGTAGGMSLFGLTGSDQVDISATGLAYSRRIKEAIWLTPWRLRSAC